MTKTPTHTEAADLWDCPCRECTALDYSATDTALSLAEYRREQFPAEWVTA